MFCHACGFEATVKEKVFRQQLCPKCDQYLHCCLNCHFYDKAAFHHCKESEAEWIQDKSMANFCDYFRPSSENRFKGKSKAYEARKKLDDLFKK